jgi:hypothetical protein
MTTPTISTTSVLVGSSPGPDWPSRFKLAFLRALRTLLQGVAGAFPAAGAGTVVLSTGYWETFGYSCIAALIAAVVSLLQNISSFLPTDPTQTQPPAT